jgi:hypothetical protein
LSAARGTILAWNAVAFAPVLLGGDGRPATRDNQERVGVSRSAAMAMVGHKTESIDRRYAIVNAGALRDAAAKIDNAAGTIPGTMTHTAGAAEKQTV